MPCSGSVIVTVDVSDRRQFGPVISMSPNAKTRAGTVLNISTTDLEFGLLGTVDELLDYASDIVGSVYSWILANGHADWLDGPAADTESEAAGHGGNEQQGSREGA